MAVISDIANDLIDAGWAIEKQAEIAPGWDEFLAKQTERDGPHSFEHLIHVWDAFGDVQCTVTTVLHSVVGAVPQNGVRVTREPFATALRIVNGHRDELTADAAGRAPD